MTTQRTRFPKAPAKVVHATRTADDESAVFTMCTDEKLATKGPFHYPLANCEHNMGVVNCEACRKVIFSTFTVHFRQGTSRANFCRKGKKRLNPADRFYTPNVDAVTCETCLTLFHKAMATLSTEPDWRPAASIAEDCYAL
jgi:hypothetical protein